MRLPNTRERYGIIAMSFHWGMAILIIGLLALGLYMADLPINPEKIMLYGWHKSFGTLVLGVAFLRLIWRLKSIIPPLPDTMPLLMKLGAHVSHAALYFFMFAMPMSGWLMSSAAGFPVSFFGLFTLPDLITPNEELRKIFGALHEWVAYGLILTIIAHVGAALFHHFIHKDNILRRMLP